MNRVHFPPEARGRPSLCLSFGRRVFFPPSHRLLSVSKRSCAKPPWASLCADTQRLRAQGTLQTYPEVPSECMWLKSQWMRDVGSQICTSVSFKAFSWHLCLFLHLCYCFYVNLLHVPLLIPLWALYYRVSASKCSLPAFTATREHDRVFFCFLISLLTLEDTFSGKPLIRM